jgi:hypothetical protein
MSGMGMSVDQAGQDEHAGRIDPFGAIGLHAAFSDTGDATVLHMHGATLDDAALAVHGDDDAALDYEILHCRSAVKTTCS